MHLRESSTKIILLDFSDNIYAGYNVSQAHDAEHNTTPRATGFSTDFTQITTADGLWGQPAQDVTFAGIGAGNLHPSVVELTTPQPTE